MSRSFHATHAAAARLEREDVSGLRATERRLARIRADLRQKRATKAGTRAPRHGHAPTLVDAIPLRTLDDSTCVHHLMDKTDITTVLRRLPRGVTDGLAGVTLRLGKEASEEAARDADFEAERDPFTGRASFGLYPGVWGGRTLGRYLPWAARIELYAFVFDAAHPDRDLWMPLLRAQGLGTLMHEVAHHHDHTCRVARGRWIAAHAEAVERYAEQMQHRWTGEIVVPYLRERYGDEVARLERWVERHGGIAIPFEGLLDDPRATGRGGLVHATRAVFSIRDGISGLIEGVRRGEEAWRVRLRLAGDLRVTDRFGEALRVVDGVLRERPDEREARLHRAELLMFLDRPAQALALAEALVEEDAGCERAWYVVMQSAAARALWPRAIEAATRRIELARHDGGMVSSFILQRGNVRLSAGDVDGARADLELAERSGRVPRLMAARLRRRIDAATVGAGRAKRKSELPPRRGWW